MNAGQPWSFFQAPFPPGRGVMCVQTLTLTGTQGLQALLVGSPEMRVPWPCPQQGADSCV